MVTPRRQQLHSRAADALTAQASMRSVDVAHHLLGAARFAEAVPVCLRSADEAERALAYGDAVAVLERVLPHVTDPLERARALCAIGRLSWFNGQPVAAAQFLIDGVEGLESLGQPVEAARFRVYLGRCHWESVALRPRRRESYEAARSVLEAVGPSADLATAYVRIAGLRVFEFDYDGCVEAATAGDGGRRGGRRRLRAHLGTRLPCDGTAWAATSPRASQSPTPSMRRALPPGPRSSPRT